MIDVAAFLWSGGALAIVAVITWVASVIKRDASIVDAVWSLMFLAALAAYIQQTSGTIGPRASVVLVLVTVWALRLSAHIAWRNHGKPEDARYREIRRNNEPNFALKSLYLVFGLQALLVWIIATPLAVAISGQAAISLPDVVGIALWVIGFGFESVGDWQLARFRRHPGNRNRVLDSGLWAYTRHPNYFGECLIWWGFFSLSLTSGGWWTVFSPILMMILLVKVSGVALLERSITARRAGYADYTQRTNAFLPGPRRRPRPDAIAR